MTGESRIRWLLIGGGVLTLLLAGIFVTPIAWARLATPGTASATDRVVAGPAVVVVPATPVPSPVQPSIASGPIDQTASVRRGTITETLSLQGRVGEAEEFPISFPVPSRVLSITLRPGQPVHEGQVLVESESVLDDAVQALGRDFDAARAEVEAGARRLEEARSRQAGDARGGQEQTGDVLAAQRELAKAEGSLANIRAELRRQMSRLTEGPAPHEVKTAERDVERARIALGAAGAAPAAGQSAAAQQAAIQQAQLDLKDAEDRLARLAAKKLSPTLLKSPFAGVIVAVDVRSGEAVEPGRTVLVVAKSGVPVIRAELTSDEAARLKVGQRATVRIDGLADGHLAATVFSLDKSERGNPVAILNVAWSQGRPPFGASARVAITLQAKRDVLIVPARAVRSAGSHRFVEYREGGSRRTTEVKVGIVDGDLAEIVSGLREGQVISSGP